MAMAMPLLNLFSQNDNWVKNWPCLLLTPEESLGTDGAKGASYRIHDADPQVQCAGEPWPCAASATAWWKVGKEELLSYP